MLPGGFTRAHLCSRRLSAASVDLDTQQPSDGRSWSEVTQLSAARARWLSCSALGCALTLNARRSYAQTVKLHHTAALVLVGWHLMVPSDTHAQSQLQTPTP